MLCGAIVRIPCGLAVRLGILRGTFRVYWGEVG